MNSASALMSSKCLRVALTGGIATGKSTIQRLFEDLGIPIFDADAVSRELVEPGQPALQEIVAQLGPQTLNAAGALDRRRVRERVFADSGAKRVLEQILHPRVRAALIERAHSCDAKYCLLAIPLLAESGGAYAWVDRVLVVDVPRAIQLARLMSRDGMTTEFAERALAAQTNRAGRLALADDIVDNAGEEAALSRPVLRLHELYLSLSKTRLVST